MQQDSSFGNRLWEYRFICPYCSRDTYLVRVVMTLSSVQIVTRVTPSIRLAGLSDMQGTVCKQAYACGSCWSVITEEDSELLRYLQEEGDR